MACFYGIHVYPPYPEIFHGERVAVGVQFVLLYFSLRVLSGRIERLENIRSVLRGLNEPHVSLIINHFLLYDDLF